MLETPKMKLVAVLLAAVLAVAMTDRSAFDEFASGNLEFTANLYREILKKNAEGNFIFSPFSIEVILALTREGAVGQTSYELTSTLGLPSSRRRTKEALRLLRRDLKKNSDELELLSANKIYLDQKFQVLDSFKKIATSLTYEADIETVNFGNNVEAANIINQWVEQQTKNKIKDLISPDSLTSLTAVILVNCLYFNGKWKFPFDSRSTRPQKFHVTKSQDREVDMMHLIGRFRYYESKKCNAKFLELPYLGANISMTIALPNDIEGLPLLEANIEEVLSAKTNIELTRFSVSLPRFKVESKLDLKPLLQNLGINLIFSEKADFRGMSKESLYVNDVIQKAFINVTELGTEAGAATSVQANMYSAVRDFTVDRPFLFYISLNNIVLFVGKTTKI